MFVIYYYFKTYKQIFLLKYLKIYVIIVQLMINLYEYNIGRLKIFLMLVLLS